MSSGLGVRLLFRSAQNLCRHAFARSVTPAGSSPPASGSAQKNGPDGADEGDPIGGKRGFVLNKAMHVSSDDTRNSGVQEGSVKTPSTVVRRDKRDGADLEPSSVATNEEAWNLASTANAEALSNAAETTGTCWRRARAKGMRPEQQDWAVMYFDVACSDSVCQGETQASVVQDSGMGASA